MLDTYVEGVSSTMLKMADRFDADADSADIAVYFPSHDPIVRPVATMQIGSRYGAHRSVSLTTIAMVLLVHAIAIFALVQARGHYIHHQEEKLTVVNLTPPPPPAAEAPPPPARPEIVAPPPVVRTPVAPTPVMTTPEPSPVTAPVIVAAPLPPAPSAPAAPSTVQAGDISAQMVAGKPPRYPIESRRRHEQGTVLLSLVVGLDGRVTAISVSRSSGFSRLDDAAMDAVRGWRWSPIIRNGQPVMVKGVVEIPFVLKG